MTHRTVSRGPPFWHKVPMKRHAALVFCLGLLSSLAVPGCGDDAHPSVTEAGDGTLSYAEAGPVGGSAGRGSFTFGVATAAAQIIVTVKRAVFTARIFILQTLSSSCSTTQGRRRFRSERARSSTWQIEHLRILGGECHRFG